MELPHYSVTSVTLPIDAALHHIRLKFLVLSFVVPELIVSSVTVRTCIREVSGLNLGMYCFFGGFYQSLHVPGQYLKVRARPPYFTLFRIHYSLIFPHFDTAVLSIRSIVQ